MLLWRFYSYCEYKKTPCTFLIYTFFLGVLCKIVGYERDKMLILFPLRNHMIIFLSNDNNELVYMEEIDVYISKNKNCNQLRYMPYYTYNATSNIMNRADF